MMTVQQPPLNILLADDDEDDRLLFKDAFDEIKIKTNVQMVHDGVQLMNYLNNMEYNLPDIVFLDLNMPLKNGFECLAEIRSAKRLKDLSIAIYSTSGSDEDIEETFVKGANVYIKKPNDFSVLKKVLGDVITINWQYHTSGLNRDTFLLSL
jgi:CheY-like chemotaxis protein